MSWEIVVLIALAFALPVDPRLILCSQETKCA